MLVRLDCVVKVVTALVFTGMSLAVEAAQFSPFRAPNLNPPAAVIGLPLWAEVPATTTYGLTTEVANHFRFSRRVDDEIVMDGETLRVRGYFERPIGDDWSVAIDVPVVHQSGGVLDDVVDGWHSALSLPDGGRNSRPEGVLEFDFANANGQFFSLTDSGSGIGDVQLSVARRIGSAGDWTVRGAVKLPTGSERLLAGSGKTDWSLGVLTVEQGDVRGRSAAYFLGAAVVDFAQPKNIAFPVEDRSLAAVIGGALTLGSRFGIKGQIDAYSTLYDTQLEELGQSAVQATLGGWLEFGRSGIFEFAIAEDLHVSTTPDVVVFFNLSWRRP